MIKKNEFFREVSVRMCGSLEIDKALWLCFQFVSRVMPVDALIISTYDQGIRCLRNIAIADSQGARLTSEEIFLKPTSQLEIEGAKRFPRARKVNSTGDDPIICSMAERMKWQPSSVLVNRLMIEGKYIGSFIALVQGEGKYTEEHLKAWGLVNEPAAIALANHLQYREVIRVKDLLADDKNYLQSELRKGIGGTLVGADFGLRAVM